MKTSVALNDEKVKTARKLSGAKTLKDLLDQALDAYIASARRTSMISLLGTDFFDKTAKPTTSTQKNGRTRR